jgi:outer membrane protein TolC
VSGQEINLAKAALATARSAERNAENAAEQARRSLELLLGRYPSAELDAADDLAAVPPPIPTGVPSAILERRPDIVAAERRVRAAFFATEQADLARLPRFSLTGGVGVTSIADTVASLGAGLVGPLFDPTIQAQIDIATADQKAAIAAYGQAALAAFEDVENALGSEMALSDQEEQTRIAADQNQSAFEKTSAQYEVGRITFLTVLQDQSRVVASRVQLLRIRSERLITRVNLHLALGGSFETSSDLPAQGKSV